MQKLYWKLDRAATYNPFDSRRRRERAALVLQPWRRRLLQPPPLPRLRPRALTSPLLPRPQRVGWRARQKTQEQAQSSLFGKLPLELRRMIYAEVLAGPSRVVHLVLLENKRLAHVRCTNPGGDRACSTACLRVYCDHGVYVGGPIGEFGGGVLGLLKTCRRVYTEAIDMLYTHNVFEIVDPDNIFRLSRTILPHRLNSIRSLSFNMQFTNDYRAQPMSFSSASFSEDLDTWVRTWAVIAGMKGLRNLRVSLGAWWFNMDPDIEARLFYSMAQVTSPTSFTVRVSWRGGDMAAHMANMPFVLVRPGEEVGEAVGQSQ